MKTPAPTQLPAVASAARLDLVIACDNCHRGIEARGHCIFGCGERGNMVPQSAAYDRNQATIAAALREANAAYHAQLKRVVERYWELKHRDVDRHEFQCCISDCENLVDEMEAKARAESVLKASDRP